MLLPVETVDPLGQNLVFPDGEVQTKFWVSETMLAKASELPESKFYPECVRAMRDHQCESYPDCIPSKKICHGGKYDLRVKWVGWLSQYSTWERDNEFDSFYATSLACDIALTLGTSGCAHLCALTSSTGRQRH